MINQIHQSLNGIYLVNPQVGNQQLSDAISACLCKAEALAAIAATTDFEAHTAEIIDNYLWVLSDTVREAKFLYKAVNIKNTGH